MRRIRTLLAIGAGVVLIAVGGNIHPRLVAQAAQSASAAASALDPVIAKAFQWRSIGPARGGRSIAVSGVKGRPKEAYFGAVGGGLWKTVDGGENWTPVTDGQVRSSSVGAVAVSESSPDVAFIGMGEACIRGNIMAGDGVYKSTDAGKTWTHVRLADAHNISKIRNDLAIATHGRGFYILDDIQPIRQFTVTEAASDAPQLFAPGEAIRGAGGARISYWLKRPAKSLTIDILDASSQVVRTYAGTMPGEGRGCGAGRGAGATGGGESAGGTGRGAGNEEAQAEGEGELPHQDQ